MGFILIGLAWNHLLLANKEKSSAKWPASFHQQTTEWNRKACAHFPAKLRKYSPVNWILMLLRRCSKNRCQRAKVRRHFVTADLVWLIDIHYGIDRLLHSGGAGDSYADVRRFECHQQRPSWGVDIGLDLFSKRCEITESLKKKCISSTRDEWS